MSKNIILVSIIILTSCKLNISSNGESIFSTPFDVFSYYQDEVSKLENIKELKQQILNKNNKEYEDLTNKYWETFSSLITFLQKFLVDEEIKEYFIKRIGLDTIDYILNIEVDRLFYSRKYEFFDISRIDETIKKIENDFKIQVDYQILYKDINELLNLIIQFKNSKLHINILSDLYLDNTNYSNEKTKLESYSFYLENYYKEIMHKILENENYSNNFINDFELTKEEVSYYLVSETYSDYLVDLFNQEAILKNEYISKSNNNEKKQIYYDLVLLRNEISKELGYSSYVEYVNKEIYYRNYNLNDVSNLINNVLRSSSLKSNYLYYAYSENKSDIYKINENQLLKNLDYVSEFIEEAKDIIKEFKTYGLYNFDYRNNKFNGSYKAYINIESKEQFIMLNVNNNINDYLSLFHEFGHYLGGILVDDKKQSSKFDLDIAEVHSQGLEYIMSNYFHLFLNKEEVKELINRLIFNALWTIYSSAMITEFENYVYINLPSIEKMQNKFNDLIEQYIFPYSFGMEKEDYIFTNISHIFLSPCYYLSYLTSIIPSLVLWSNNDLELVKKQYKTILSFGTSNDFIYVLNQVNLPSPFERESIILIENQINKIKRLS